LARRAAILRATLQFKAIARPTLQTKVQAAATEVEGAEAEEEAVVEAEAIRRKESGIASSTRRIMTTVQTIVQTRKGLRPS
jgi:hypothetical protein